MKQLTIVFFLAAVLLASCSHDKSNVISENKMANVLRDIHMVDGTLNTYQYSMNKFQNTDSLYVYKMAFDKNKVTRQEFIKSLEYYSKYPKKMDRIYTAVINELSSQQQNIMEELQKKHKADSIKASDSLKRSIKDPTKPQRIIKKFKERNLQ